MKTIKYYLITLLALLSIDSNAQIGIPMSFLRNDAKLWTDLGEITQPRVLHETENAYYGSNTYGNANNDVFYSFVVRRPTIFSVNYNGTPLEDVNAHLLYSPLGKDCYVNVGDPMRVENDYEKFIERLKLEKSMNYTIEERLNHGWIGTLFFQVLEPGCYILHCEEGAGNETEYSAYIKNNIYINPVGTSKEQPMHIGAYRDDFNFEYSGTFADQPSEGFYFSMNMEKPINIHVSSKGTQADSLTIRIREKSSGNLVADSRNFPVEDDSYPQVGNVRLNTGVYIFEFTYSGEAEFRLNITGRLNLLQGDTQENPLLIEMLSDEIDYQNTFNTTDYTNFYIDNNKYTKDVFHRFESKVPMNILISCPNTIKEGAAITVLNAANQKVSTLDTRKQSELQLPGLAPGTYYIVSEGNLNDGLMTLRVQGSRFYNYAVSADRNYISTVIPTTSASSPVILNNPNKAQRQVMYYDYLGCPEQSVQYAASPLLKDLVTHTEYDGLGRESKKWLPVTSPFAASYVPLAPIEVLSSFLYSDACAYEKTLYEASPLNRIIENYGAGEDWQKTGHSIKKGYRLNASTDRCRNFSISGNRHSPALLQHAEPYSPYELEVTETTDEDGHSSYHFTDKQGHLILERVVADGDTLDTYYVYDDFNNLCFVLPPIAADSLNMGSPQEILDLYAYQYCYDDRNRCIGKKLPGCDWIESIYDRTDKLVFSQDGEQRKRKVWNVALSDPLGHSVIIGLYKGHPDRKYYEQESIYAVFTPDSVSTYYGYTIKGLPIDSMEVLRVDYYDTYDYKHCHLDFPTSLNYEGDSAYGKRHGNDEKPLGCKGLLTGSINTVLENGYKLFSSTYYDFYQHPVQVRSTTLNDRTIVSKSLFNFAGQVIGSREEYSDSVALLKHYIYDHAKRLTEEIHSLNAQDSIRFKYAYDELGRMKSLTRSHGTHSFTTDNEYNIRSWLTAINSSQFTQTLHYTDGAGMPCYNGNISSMTWQTDPSQTRGYRFTYDGLSRLINATYGEGDHLAIHPNRFNEQVTGYDRNGNILGLKRFGQTVENDYGLIDSLSLSYNGNQLKAVNDSAVSSAYGSSFEFKDGTKKEVEYSYDANGYLTQDLNKKISEIQYNCLNLPRRIQFEDGSSISYLYDAAGTKLRVAHHIEGKTTTTDYCGNAIFENGVLHKLLTAQGYITLPDTTYHYFIQDHQGNNRIVVDQNGTVEEANHYYPFGGVFANSTSVQPYKYNGKELDRSNGLDWYDYGARHYDAAIGRWHAVDPMSEKYFGITPYAYCNNDPIKNIDLDGRDWYLYGATGQLYYNRDLNQNQITFNDNSYVRVGANNMLGDMTDVVEKSFSFEESASLAQTNGYNINPIQQLQSEESREQNYPTGKNSVSITTGKIEIVNEKYGIFAANKDKVVGVKTEPLFDDPFGLLDAVDTMLSGGKKTDYVERNYITYEKSKTEDKVYNAIGRVFGIMSTVTTGKQDYRTVNIYNNWNAYSKATKGIGRMLDYKK